MNVKSTPGKIKGASNHNYTVKASFPFPDCGILLHPSKVTNTVCGKVIYTSACGMQKGTFLLYKCCCSVIPHLLHELLACCQITHSAYISR
jgi:hypothetical protein